MSTKRTLQAQYEFLALPALMAGADSLQEWERLAVAMLYVKEVRKGSFKFAGGDDATHVKAFLDHVMAEFVEDVDLKVVLDFQPRLIATAKDLAHRPHPIEAVILYATWIEHWLNATLITAGLAKGLSEPEVTQMIRDTGIPGKLSWLWKAMNLPSIPDSLRGQIAFLAEVRNEHVHYKWKGHDPDLLTHETSRLQQAIQGVDKLVNEVIDFEIHTLLGEYMAVADRLFNTSVAPGWRNAALTRPMSAPQLVEKLEP